MAGLMTKDAIRYDLLVQQALKGVIRRVLNDVLRDGLPGEHHFFISFRTHAPNVRLSQRLRDKYPDEMTIVLQHQFWDLGVTEHAFEVGLSFSGIPERLLIPFDAMTGFYDPSVQFGLKFEVADTDEDMPVPDAAGREAPAPEPATIKPLRKPSRADDGEAPRGRKTDAGKAEPARAETVKTKADTIKADGKSFDTKASDGKASDGKGADGKAGKGKASDKDASAKDGPPKDDAGSATVVSLDAFRKK
jgi:hypothetical protein